MYFLISTGIFSNFILYTLLFEIFPTPSKIKCFSILILYLHLVFKFILNSLTIFYPTPIIGKVQNIFSLNKIFIVQKY
jgi:hypothetical protein